MTASQPLSAAATPVALADGGGFFKASGEFVMVPAIIGMVIALSTAFAPTAPGSIPDDVAMVSPNPAPSRAPAGVRK